MKARLVDSYVFEYDYGGFVSKSFLKTSISRNHAHCILHGRFPPFGFVLKPSCSIGIVSAELWRILTLGSGCGRWVCAFRYRDVVKIKPDWFFGHVSGESGPKPNRTFRGYVSNPRFDRCLWLWPRFGSTLRAYVSKRYVSRSAFQPR